MAILDNPIVLVVIGIVFLGGYLFLRNLDKKNKNK